LSKIRSTAREVTHLQRKLDKIVPTGVSAHQEIILGRETEVEIEQNDKGLFLIRIVDPQAMLMF
jgi:hypothetical protein